MLCSRAIGHEPVALRAQLPAEVDVLAGLESRVEAADLLERRAPDGHVAAAQPVDDFLRAGVPAQSRRTAAGPRSAGDGGRQGAPTAATRSSASTLIAGDTHSGPISWSASTNARIPPRAASTARLRSSPRRMPGSDTTIAPAARATTGDGSIDPLSATTISTCAGDDRPHGQQCHPYEESLLDEGGRGALAIARPVKKSRKRADGLSLSINARRQHQRPASLVAYPAHVAAAHAVSARAAQHSHGNAVLERREQGGIGDLLDRVEVGAQRRRCRRGEKRQGDAGRVRFHVVISLLRWLTSAVSWAASSASRR